MVALPLKQAEYRIQESSVSSLLLLIPTYNEFGNVTPIATELWALLPEAHLLFVDDGSTDGTREELAHLARDPRCHLLLRDQKRGLGDAYRAAFAWGLARHYTWLCQMDADGSHRPQDIARLWHGRHAAELLIGSRHVAQAGPIAMSPARRALSFCGSVLARHLLKLPIRDVTGGCNAWHRDLLLRMNWQDAGAGGFAIQIELKERAVRAGARFHETPIHFLARSRGRSKLSRRDIHEALALIIRLKTKPTHFHQASVSPPSFFSL